MTLGERRLATLAAVFAPASAISLLARRAGEGGAETVAHAARLVAAARDERLRAFAAVLCGDPGAARTRATDAAAAERPRLAALLRAVASGAVREGEVAPVLLRLCTERLAR